MTRLINTGEHVLTHKNEALGKAALSAEMARRSAAMVATWPPPPPETIGVLWHVITAGFDRSQALFLSAQHLNVQPTRPEGSADEQLLRSFFGKLRAMWDGLTDTP